MKTIQDLPNEVLTEIFGWWTHTEKLISRLVCTDWNYKISLLLAKTSYFTLISEASQETMFDTDIHWTKLKISDDKELFYITSTQQYFITDLRIVHTGLKECLAAVIQFPNLTTLVVIFRDKCQLKMPPFSVESEKSETELQLLKNQFKECVKKLKNLSVTFQFAEYDYLAEFLKVFDADEMCLVSLRIQEEFPRLCESPGGFDNSKLPLANIYRIIMKSAPTLISLELDFCSKYIQSNLFPDVVSKLKDLKLKNVLIKPDARPKLSKRDFLIHQEFLKTQISTGTSVTKNIILPWCPSTSLCQEFMDFLPRNIRCSGYIAKEHVSDEFYPKLYSVTIDSRELSLFTKPNPYIQKLQVHFMEFVDESESPEEPFNFYRVIGDSLVNLTELYIIVRVYDFVSSVHDKDLQLIIKHMQQLRVLHIDPAYCPQVDHSSSCPKLTNFGVTGIQDPLCMKHLKKTGRLYYCVQIPKEKQTGLPLSSLKKLEKLVIDKSMISDVGLYYGLQFGPTLKQLTLNTVGKVNEWGLNWLAVGNPGLESFDVHFSSGSITLAGREDLRRQMPLVESTRKFRLVYKYRLPY